MARGRVAGPGEASLCKLWFGRQAIKSGFLAEAAAAF